MASLNGFNAAEVEPSTGFDPIPAGEYLATIIESEQKTTKAGDGEYLKLVFEVLDGAFRGRKLFVNLNLKNPNPEAVRIARAELSAICRAVGVLAPKDSVEIHNLPLTVKVGLKKNDLGESENRIKGYTPRGGVKPAAKPVAPKTGEEKAPW